MRGVGHGQVNQQSTELSRQSSPDYKEQVDVASHDVMDFPATSLIRAATSVIARTWRTPVIPLDALRRCRVVGKWRHVDVSCHMKSRKVPAEA